MKNKITSTIITLILLTPLLLAQTTQTNLDNLNNISSENIQTYIDLNNEDRNTALENTEDPLKRHNANSQLTKELIREKFEASLASGAIRLIGKKFGINKEELLETNPNDLVIQGFENLKFAEKGNIIGDGNTYLDLDNLPRGLNKIEYKQGNTNNANSVEVAIPNTILVASGINICAGKLVSNNNGVIQRSLGPSRIKHGISVGLSHFGGFESQFLKIFKNGLHFVFDTGRINVFHQSIQQPLLDSKLRSSRRMGADAIFASIRGRHKSRE